MTTDLITPESVPSLWRLARLDFDAVRERPVLLYPEGAVFLNDTGRAILELCDGRRTVGEIAATLRIRYDADAAADVAADVTDYLAGLAARELIDVR